LDTIAEIDFAKASLDALRRERQLNQSVQKGHFKGKALPDAPIEARAGAETAQLVDTIMRANPESNRERLIEEPLASAKETEAEL
jgi:hypothetical protein